MDPNHLAWHRLADHRGFFVSEAKKPPTSFQPFVAFFLFFLRSSVPSIRRWGKHSIHIHTCVLRTEYRVQSTEYGVLDLALCTWNWYLVGQAGLQHQARRHHAARAGVVYGMTD